LKKRYRLREYYERLNNKKIDFEELVDKIPVGLAVIDSEFRIIKNNKVFNDIFDLRD
jgi:PAS domain-containing protein